ncbi:nucleotidyl transferase AbiEii/AbiGii toxin family protein [Adlercreutzia sp. ZJ473]|uniref:nucleotidyl transferase AbiEii/AbiGii toxin family protein n=1 Tax=Adlercreutzia sp. ZJ473 TaxID=2722822 RepID=UPI001552D77E|nr:nucleotidyl transferase AbiEii/AbiGii toxin family protein [Adlercreutzia sp. ZJ473]
MRADILEKDYYVTLLLEELASKQDWLPAYFKGGTALYKALGKMRRFSEDIDIMVRTDGCSKTQGKKRLEAAANGYVALVRDKEDPDSSNRRGSITSVYRYEGTVPFAALDALQRFGRVKVEATSFTVSEPTAPMEVSALVWDLADSTEREVLSGSFSVFPFEVQTITLERIFVDKVFAAQFYYERGMLLDAAKHLYDVCVLVDDENIRALLSTEGSFESVARFKRAEELSRIGSNQAQARPADFAYLRADLADPVFEAFEKMQRIYVLDEQCCFDAADVVSRLRGLRSRFREWT